MNLERRLRAANRVLAAYSPKPLDPTQIQSAPSTPYLQWCFSDPGKYDHICPPLWFMSWDSDIDGNPVYDYYCACGVNQSVHSADCRSMIIPKIRMVRTKSAPLIEASWVLCRWIPPPSLQSWTEFYGTAANYPNNGRYLPLSHRDKVITLPEETPPFPETSEYVVNMMREWEARQSDFQSEADAVQTLKDWTPPRTPSGLPDTRDGILRGSKFEGFRDQLKDSMIREKGSVVWSRSGSSPSKPNPVTHSTEQPT